MLPPTFSRSNIPTVIEPLGEYLALSPQQRLTVVDRITNGASIIEAFADVADDSAIAAAFGALLGLRVVTAPTELIPEPQWLAKIPLRIWAAARALPLPTDDPTTLSIAVVDPFDAAALDAVRVASGGVLPDIVVAPRLILHTALREHLGVGADTVQSLIDSKGEEAQSQVDLADAAEDASIIRLVNQVLLEALERRATDVHFEPFEGRFAVRYRVDGELVEAKLPAEVRRLQAAIVSRLKILASLDIAEKRLPQDGRIRLRLSGRDVDVRVSIIPMLHGEAVVLRLLDRSAALVGLGGTGMVGRDLTIFQKALELPHGIVLITGPTGSGKTTTLYAGLTRINTPDLKIVTIEDPVEYQLDGINQIQVDTRTGLTFAKGLRAILRHDPDVVLIGEIRDLTTAETTVRAAASGQLVFASLHAPVAAAALQSMLLSNQQGAQCLREFGATACTDVTGFGLLGHLVEMTRPSGVDAELTMSTLPLLDGAVDCVKAGIVSSLQPANVRLRRALRNADEFVDDPRYPLLFDPQTAGGLLASVPAAQAAACVQALKAAGYPHTAIIGRITAQGNAIEPVLLKT